MKNYIIEKQMTNSTDGYFVVVVEGETHQNKTVIKSQIQFFTTEGGYDYCHPIYRAEKNAQAIADGLNQMQRENDSSGLTEIELEIEQVVDAIKAEPSTIKCIVILEKYLQCCSKINTEDLFSALTALDKNNYGSVRNFIERFISTEIPKLNFEKFNKKEYIEELLKN